MRSRHLTSGAALGGLLWCAACCAAQATQVDPNEPAEASARYQAPPAKPTQHRIPGMRAATASERAGLGLLSVSDQYHADLSRLALDRGLDPDIQAWAESILDAHAAAKGRHDPWLPDLGKPRAQARIRDGQRELAALHETGEHQVSAAYLHAMRRSLADTLQLVDHELIPQASTPDVAAHLRQVRMPLAVELATARRLRPQDGLPPGAPP